MEEIFDIAVIGGGPAGLSAVLTGKNRNKKVVLFEHLGFSQKLQKAHVVDNYLGLSKISGQDLMKQFATHVLAHEPVLVKEKVVNVFVTTPAFTLVTGQSTYQAKTVIIATGVVATTLFRGEKELLGRGVSYCATCDGMLYRDKDVAVISYTPEGEHETNFLAEVCRSVTYLPQYRGEYSNLTPNVRILKNRPQAILGEGKVDELVTDGENIKAHGVFIMRQSDPVENIIPELELSGEVIKVDRQLLTNIPGIFAAGDCTGRPWQIAKATGEGLVAGLSAINYLDDHNKQDG
ncbi:thioredoxin reductase (NADPH) [Sporomusaceae bacterium BoRhaA]|uniref:NAD(P)/FAD-dependent oxidoreductase n=1 Tax=Pelorhabdus rhamnosifermentans TaxID=2772457 RepID=UPI001C061BA8|nr:NAD(P)/FAD-dependent oxidoreductase [Pelorhabdus rhamnosifermentans]MBU2702047.1 thioredoxin reductase (NADPH) [Pelorhabdus rhamnosifermentans]